MRQVCTRLKSGLTHKHTGAPVPGIKNMSWVSTLTRVLYPPKSGLIHRHIVRHISGAVSHPDLRVKAPAHGGSVPVFGFQDFVGGSVPVFGFQDFVGLAG